MPIDRAYIEQLVLDELSNVITPEDSITLKLLLEKEPEAHVIRNNLHLLFESQSVSEIINKLPVTLSSEKVLLRIRRRRNSKLYALVIFTLSILLSLFSSYHLPRSESITAKLKIHPDRKEILLHISNGETLNLDTLSQKAYTRNLRLNGNLGATSYRSPQGNEYGILNIPPGKNYSITLSDGTEVELNSSTQLKFPFSFNGNTREITIDGEAYIKVAGNSNKPFIIHLPYSTIMVLGTEFNINTYDTGSIRVSLVSGSVKVKAGTDSLIAYKGQETNLSNNKDLYITFFNEEKVLAWRKGIYIFDSANITELTQVIRRLYGIQVVTNNGLHTNKKFRGFINRNKPVSFFLESLKFTGEFNYYFDIDSTLHLP